MPETADSGDLTALVRKLVHSGVEYSAGKRYGGHWPACVRGYDPHGTHTLTDDEEDLLRECLGMPTKNGS